jgi:quinol monooxygenase YgiN
VDVLLRAGKEIPMVTTALLVLMEAKAGKEEEVANFLRGGLEIVEEEPHTTVWFALRMGKSMFGIFDAFPDEAGREAHLAGRVAAALMAKAPDLFEDPPGIEKFDIVAAKMAQPFATARRAQ